MVSNWLNEAMLEGVGDGQVILIPNGSGHSWSLWKRPGRWVLTPVEESVKILTPDTARDKGGQPQPA